MRIHQIIRRTYYSVKIVTESPLSISNGESDNTDSDVLTNGSGEFFVPGTSLAGAFRNYIGISKDTDCIYGYSSGENGRMSSMIISDMYFDNDKKLVRSVRDGVALTDEKNVDNKFDMEIIEPGITGMIRLEVIQRDGDSYDHEGSILRLINGIQSGEIRLGANKNRGFGRLRILGVSEKTFDKESRNEWIKECKSGIHNSSSDDYMTYDEWIKGKEQTDGMYVTAARSLVLRGGISIRRYSAKPGKADYEHITSNGRPVVPGTSWNGAIRADAKMILSRLGCSENKVQQLIKQWFGFVDIRTDNSILDIDSEKARQSMIVISESIIEGARPLPIKRNKISRFSSGTADGALYSEIAYYDGTTTLQYMIKKDNERSYKALIGLMEIVSGDIAKGYVSIGGLAGVGRGLFSEDTHSRIIYSEEVDVSECMTELYNIVRD